MKHTYFGIAVPIILAIFCLTWYGCTKEETETNDKVDGAIYGTITDFATGEPVINANVSLRPGGETTLTGIDGMYEFLNVEDGDYSITVSKAEYTTLIDPYTIQVKNGKRMRRDVQIKKKPTIIQTVDANGHDISIIDFGSDASMVAKTLYIFNNGTVTVSCRTEYTCSWIASVSSLPNQITPGQTVPVTVNINRNLLASGQNTTVLTFATNNGSAEITVKASSASGNPPEVQINPVNNITATTAQCEGRVINAHGGDITNCGFCYCTNHTPTINDIVMPLGPCSGSFSSTLANLARNTTYHVRAFATSNLGTGYSSEITFTTVSGLPTCGSTTITNLDPATARGQSSASASNGYSITEKGICWSTNHTPTTNDQTATSGFGDGEIRAYLSSLQPNTTYRVRSYATNEFGTSYGPEMTFTTMSGIPTVTTSAASFVEYYYDDYIMTGGNVTDDQGTAVYSKGVCYGFNPNPDLSSSFQHTNDDSGTGPFTSYIPMPTSSGYLYIRAYATTRYGTGYGNQVMIYIP